MTVTSDADADTVTGGSDGSSKPIIETIGLIKSYPGTDFRAVDGLDLRVSMGEVYGLLGPNGAGKTTTVGVLTTRVIPSAGQAFVGGIDVVAHPTLAKQMIGVVSQQNTLDRQLTPWENLYFHGRLFGMGKRECKQTADDLLERFQLTKFGAASVYALSGGMAQRLMVARAIFHRPAVLFLDEPTAGLDPQGRLALWDLLRGLNAEGQTIMLTTHYMEEADQLCNRVAIMDHGKVLALDTPAALKRSVGADTIVTVKAEGDPAVLADIFQRGVEGIRRTRAVPGGVELHFNGSDHLVPRVVAAADAAGYSLADLSVAEPTLETVFIGLTGKELRD
jgi:ABC-2 type transport system ATP-binding protein